MAMFQLAFELLTTSHKVSSAVYFYQHTDSTSSVDVAAYESFCRYTPCFFYQEVMPFAATIAGFGHIAIGFYQCLLQSIMPAPFFRAALDDL